MERATAPSVKGWTLSVSPNGRHLINQDGSPFFYLADTAWTLFKRLTHEEVCRYLHNRAAKGFTVVQAYVLRGLEVPNLYGDLPLEDRDPTRLGEGFFQNVDYVVDRANDFGLVMGLVTTMGMHVAYKARQERFTGNEQVFNADNAFLYGELLGARYRENCVIWLLGGDHQPSEETVAVWDAMARGLKAGSQGSHLVSYHSSGGYSSSSTFHQADWLDFNTVQSGHLSAEPNYELIETDYALTPVKPTLDMEARYEDGIDGQFHPRLVANPSGRISARQVREAAYWAVFAGAAGHGYGHQSIWQLNDEMKTDSTADYSFPLWPATSSWLAAMDSDGAFSMGHLRRLLELRPWHTLVPDQEVVALGQGMGEDHVRAARAEDGSFALAYLPFGHTIVVRMGKIAADAVDAYWFSPRTGTFLQIDRYTNSIALREFVPPTSGENQDWVLVLDDSSRAYSIW